MTIVLQTAGIVWWAAGVNNTLQNHDDKLKGFSGTIERLTVVETELKNINKTLERLETKFDRRTVR